MDRRTQQPDQKPETWPLWCRQAETSWLRQTLLHQWDQVLRELLGATDSHQTARAQGRALVLREILEMIGSKD